MQPEQTELISYLKNATDELKRLQRLSSQRNKTKKFKAITSMALIAWNRANATYNYAKSGGYEDLSVVIQQQMFDPIIQWLESEIA